jgi:hypothetical protein
MLEDVNIKEEEIWIMQRKFKTGNIMIHTKSLLDFITAR